MSQQKRFLVFFEFPLLAGGSFCPSPSDTFPNRLLLLPVLRNVFRWATTFVSLLLFA